MRETDFEKSIAITGASRGIGAALAQEFVRAGWRVAALARWSQSEGRPSPDLPDGVTGIAYDALQKTTDQEDRPCTAVHDVSPMLADVCAWNNGKLPHVFVINHGTAANEESSLTAVWLLLLNLVSYVLITYRLLEMWEKQGRPLLTICYTGSYMERLPLFGANQYALTKVGLAMLAYRLRQQHRGTSLHVMHASPGVVNTTIWDHQLTMTPWFRVIMTWLGTSASECARNIMHDIIARKNHSKPTRDAKLVFCPGIGRLTYPVYTVLRYLGYEPVAVYHQWLAARHPWTRWFYRGLRQAMIKLAEQIGPASKSN